MLDTECLMVTPIVQASYLECKSTEHHRNCQHIHCAEDNAPANSFGAPASNSKLRCLHKKLTSTSAGDNGHSSTANLPHQSPGTCNASETGLRDRPNEETNPCTLCRNVSSDENEKGEADLRRSCNNKSVSMEVEELEESDSPSGCNKLQEHKTIAPCGHVCQQTKVNEEVQDGQEGNSLDNRGAPVSEDRNSTAFDPKPLHLTAQGGQQVQESKIPKNSACEEDKNGTGTQKLRDVSSKSVQPSLVSNNAPRFPELPSLVAGIVIDEVEKRSLATERELEGIEKTRSLTERGSGNKQLALGLSSCGRETIVADLNEKQRSEEVNVSGCSSEGGEEGLQNNRKMLDLNQPSFVFEVPLVSDITARMVADEMQKQSLVREKKGLSSLLSNEPDLITLSSDGESSNSGHGLFGSSTNIEAEVSECTSRSDRKAMENTESDNMLRYSSPVCSREPISLPTTPAFQLFPEADPVVQGGTELDVGRTFPPISPRISLSRPEYVTDGNVWIPRSTRQRLKKEGCGKDLRLSL